MAEVSTEKKVLNNKRRTLLFLGASTGAAFVAGKLFGGTVADLLGFPSAKEKITSFKNFTVKEDDKEMILFDKEGEAVFIVEKD